METIRATEGRRLVGNKDFAKYTGVSHNTADRLARKIGCRVKIGRRVLYDLRKADAYFDTRVHESAGHEAEA